MNKSTLSERRNMNNLVLNGKIRKFSISTKSNKIEEESIHTEIGLMKKISQALERNQQYDRVKQQQTPTLLKSFNKLGLTSPGKVKQMINEASNFYAESIPFEDSFIIEQKLGQGAHGVVKKCYHKESKKVYAVKILKMEDEHFRSIKTNFINIKQLKNEHIIKYKALYLSSKKRICYLVMEYLPYKKLHSGLEQTVLRIICHKLITALAYMHQKGICHRDLKPDNILFDEQKRLLKIIDFGVSKNMKLRGKYQEMLTNTGQLYYRAPQMFLGGSYNQKVDSWAIGVTLYELIVGKTPFEDEYMIQTIQNIQSKTLDFEDENFKRFNPIVKDLISKLLQRDVKKRFTCKEASMHFWFLPHLQNKDLMKSASGVSFDLLDKTEMRADLSVAMGRGISLDNRKQQDREKITKGEKVVMKSWLEMINQDTKGLNEQQYKFQFVESESEDDDHPFRKQPDLSEVKSQKKVCKTEDTSPLFGKSD